MIWILFTSVDITGSYQALEIYTLRHLMLACFLKDTFSIFDVLNVLYRSDDYRYVHYLFCPFRGCTNELHEAHFRRYGLLRR